MGGAVKAITSAFTDGTVVGQMFIKPQQDALDLQKKAQEQALAQAKAQADLQDQANNRAAAKAPNVAALLMGNKGATGGTLLTGPQGVDPSKLLLGKNTLLGG